MGRSTSLTLAPILVRLWWKRCHINWGTENWQNLNLLVNKKLKMKGSFNCHALASTGTFVTSMLRLFGLVFSLSTLCGLYGAIVWNSSRMCIVSFYHDCFVLFISCFFLFHLNLSYWVLGQKTPGQKAPGQKTPGQKPPLPKTPRTKTPQTKHSFQKFYDFCF